MRRSLIVYGWLVRWQKVKKKKRATISKLLESMERQWPHDQRPLSGLPAYDAKIKEHQHGDDLKGLP